MGLSALTESWGPLLLYLDFVWEPRDAAVSWASGEAVHPSGKKFKPHRPVSSPVTFLEPSFVIGKMRMVALLPPRMTGQVKWDDAERSLARTQQAAEATGVGGSVAGGGATRAWFPLQDPP